MFFKRNITEKLQKALTRSPVVLLTGARQTGKSTLVKKLTSKEKFSNYVSFDDLRYLSAAKSDPIGFLSNIEKPTILDEVQRVPEIFLSIKNYIDQNRIPGTFILTGSANPLLIPTLGDSLAGRMEIVKLYPLSVGEIIGTKESFIDLIFDGKIQQLKATKINKETIFKKLILGGYPPVQNLDQEGVDAWFNSYLETILQRDVKDLAKIEGLTQLPNLLNLIATRVGGLLNIAELSRSSGISNSTLHRYLTLLETLYLITFIQPWSTNLGKRFVKSSKLYLIDCGILLHLVRCDEERLMNDSQIFGRSFENFIVTEILKQATWCRNQAKIYHYRTQSGNEVDLILEDKSGRVFGIEIKSSETITKDHFKGLSHLQETLKDKFVGGIVLYTGNEKIPFGNNLWAIPVNAMWEN
ncbi:TPA: hypothetical protein DEO28_00475 [Candidatus Dependentiae bacterium]|nr:MAG: hypothetical protein UR14_C0001G0054 [candidate division TM6 bacterium GW2011_GWE2_31_21]KKP54066.1 MAG: hypothetical protein UR43_C0001G0084 [candidate division TM6 bacterium GW2011_GWF2_33_332]HBS48352.1 hypothetical protein [Candidatus Dependentiae bacterium]HBZ72974.1 hypothetical protein [Candidatus Dependentiae bacterium]